ncbi:MAG: DUF3868 domain-containing protein [Muribaculaceae bacterium]|nr:DUF3868 domain-containing protein [Muribaculaceae bacterium]
MKKINYITTILVAVISMPLMLTAAKTAGNIDVRDIKVARVGENLNLTANIVLDDIHLSANKQLFITPLIESGENNSVIMPTVLVNGRNMHIAYQRGTIKRIVARYDVIDEVKRANGKSQTIIYDAKTQLQPWMLDPSATVKFTVDSCGCGQLAGTVVTPEVYIDLNPIESMHLAFITPAVTDLPVAIHEGKARVQFEVDKTELHIVPYTCANGQRIDNRSQLAIINDSIKYALSDPNVEIASINICGYASPESPYTHNDYLATNRSRALSEYIGRQYNLPQDRVTYNAVPENWEEFRDQVLESRDITPQQRADLLELIDRPAYGPSDYDAKERELKTSPKFAELYRSKILPQWFPRLRATKFTISTRLKPHSDQELARIIEKTPRLMSLNQMFRVARLYPEGSDEFNKVIDTALRYYADNPVANLNAAVAAIKVKDYDAARKYLEKAGNSPEADNARGILATALHDFDMAKRYFEQAGNLPEAMRNKALLTE